MTCITDPFKPTPGIIKKFIGFPYIIWRIYWNILWIIICKSIDALYKFCTSTNGTFNTGLINSTKGILANMSIFAFP